MMMMMNNSALAYVDDCHEVGESSNASSITIGINATVAEDLQQQQQEHQEQQDRLFAMFCQEESYACPDYLSPNYRIEHNESLKQSIAKSLSIVEECALLVTDLSIARSRSSQVDDDHQSHGGASSPQYLRRKSTDSSPPPPPSTSMGSPKSSATHLFPFYSVVHEQSTSPMGEWREKMITWAFSALDALGHPRALAAVAIDFLDRYMARELIEDDVVVTREDFQLFAMTAVYLAVKLFTSTSKLSLEAMVDMSRGYFTRADFEETEVDMLAALEWKLSPPTAQEYCLVLADYIQPTIATQRRSGRWRKDIVMNSFSSTSIRRVVAADAIELCEIALSDSYWISRPKSHLAVAALLLASCRYGCGGEEDWRALSVMAQPHMNLKSPDFTEDIRRLQHLYC